MNEVAVLARTMVAAVGEVIKGKDEVIGTAVLGLLCEGHLLLEDVPGTGKTTLARALAAAIDGSFARVQFTPDLLPSDVTGTSVFDARSQDFSFRPGPIFANIVLADEINRASPKTQSALLEVMAERQVTTDGVPAQVPQPFLVLATQNPVDSDGTYLLPHAQLDRFAMQISLGYPDPAAEVDVLAGRRRSPEEITPVCTAQDFRAAIEAVRRVQASDDLCRYVVDLAAATRSHPELRLGASPRAALTLLAVAKARAATQGRSYVLPEDVKSLAATVLAHRMVLTTAAQAARRDARGILAELLSVVDIPTAAAAATV